MHSLEDLVNGLDGKHDGISWDKDHVFESFEMECKSHVNKSRMVCFKDEIECM